MATMAYTGPGIDINLPAGADLSTHQFKAVKMNTSGQVVLCSVSGEASIGILQNKPKSGEGAQVRTHGVSKAVAGAAVPQLAGITPIMTNASGLIIAGTSTNKSMGYGLIPAAAANDVISVYVQPLQSVLP